METPPKPVRTLWKPRWANSISFVTLGFTFLFNAVTGAGFIISDLSDHEDMFDGLGTYIGSILVLTFLLQLVFFGLFQKFGNPALFAFCFLVPAFDLLLIFNFF